MKFRSSLIAAALATVSVAALAKAPQAPSIDARQHQQQQRIAQGVASGELNAREAQRLQRQQREIRFAEARARADGVVTRAEYRHLTQLLDQAGRDIARQKHDGQVAYRR